MQIKAIVIRILRQFRRDKRSLALMFAAPLLVLTLMWLVFDSEQYQPSIGAINTPTKVLTALENQEVHILKLTETKAWEKLEEGTLDAIIEWKGKPFVTLEGSDPTANGAVKMVVQQAIAELLPQDMVNPSFNYLYGSNDLGLFDNVGPVLIGLFVFFFVFLIGGVSFLRERTQGTLERMLSTPLKRWQIVLGYVIGFGIFTIIQSLLIAWYSIEVLGMLMEGSFWYVLLITFSLAMSALTLGTLLSAFANNEFQMIQFIPLVIVPQVFFSGMFNLETMADWLRVISKIMPLTYGAEALREIMIRGQEINAFWEELVILTGFSISFFILNVWALKKHRRL